MDKKKTRQYEARLTEQRNMLLGMVERTEDYGAKPIGMSVRTPPTKRRTHILKNSSFRKAPTSATPSS